MKKLVLSAALILLIAAQSLSAQDSSANGKSFGIPSEKYGIGFGNSYEFTGIRFNLADEDTKEINGLNVTLWFKFAKNMESEVNGISLGIIPTGGSMHPVNIGVLGVGTHHNIYGLNLAGVVIGSGGNIGGLSVGGLLVMADGKQSNLSGLIMAGLGIGGNKAINGIAVGGLAVGTGTEGDINGITVSSAYLGCDKNFRGIGVTAGYLEAGSFSGIAAAGYAKTNQMTGLSVSLFNNTNELHGIQIGVLNHAENNSSWTKWLPFVNMNFSGSGN